MDQQAFTQQPVLKSGFLKQAVIGLSDGLIISFAIATSLYVLGKNTLIILQSTLFLGIILAIVIGIGGYLSAKFRMESLAAKTIEEEERSKKEETEKTVALFQRLDINEDMQEQAAIEIERDSEEWKNFLQKNQQPFEVPDPKALPKTGFIIGFSFLTGALCALVAYFILKNVKEAFKLSIFINLPLLFIVGSFKSKINRESVFTGGIRLLFLGAATAASAYFVAGIFLK